MIENHEINGKQVWLKVDPYLQKTDPHVIPTEYFVASYFFSEPSENTPGGEMVKEDNGEPMLFESPVAALAFARKRLEAEVNTAG